MCQVEVVRLEKLEEARYKPPSSDRLRPRRSRNSFHRPIKGSIVPKCAKMDKTTTDKPLFTELFRLARTADCLPPQKLPHEVEGLVNEYCWKEVARYVLYEEIFDDFLNEFTPPQIPVINYKCFTYLQKTIRRNTLGEPTSLHMKRTNMHLNACLPEGTESCCVLTGYVQELRHHVYVLTRLKTAIDGLGMVEVNNPLRFIVLFLTSDRSQLEATNELGRCFAVLMEDPAFRMTAYAAPDANVIIQAMETYLQTTVVLPRSAIKSAIVGETGLALPQPDPVQFEREDLVFDDFQADLAGREGRHSVVSGFAQQIATIPRISTKNLKKFCPPFKQLLLGCSMWIHRYCSDFKDAFAKDNISTVLSSIPFVFFVVFGPTITIGNLYRITSQLSRSLQIPFSNFRFWIGVYTSMYGLIFIGLNFSNLAKYARRSLEELFSSFVAFYFILKALFALFKVIPYTEEAFVNGTSTNIPSTAAANMCLAFWMARYWVGAFNVPLGMIFVTVMERIFFRNYQLPTLNIPKFNDISVSSWIRTANLSAVNDFGAISAPAFHGLSAVIGLFFTLLIFCETMLNSITALKPKAKKPSPVIMDHILTNVAFPLISVFLGWPFMSGVPVRTIANTMALVKLEPHPPPGKPAQIISLVEQRVNLLIVGLLVMCTVALGDVLRFIPIAALYGMFLFVGMSGLRGLDLTNSIYALLSRRKYWGRWEFLSNLPKQQLAVFTLIRFCELSLLITIMIIAEFSSAGWISFAFPLIIIISALIREFILPRWRWLAVYLEILDRRCIQVATRKSTAASLAAQSRR
nr:unnamed protein product [Spirometra erinaceieuropaei]